MGNVYGCAAPALGGVMEEVRRLALVYALQNAVRYGGRAMVKPVVSKLLGSRSELRSMARERKFFGRQR